MSAIADPAVAGTQLAEPRGGLRSLLHRLVSRPAGAVGAALTALVVLSALLTEWIAPGDPFLVTRAALREPSQAHPFGTDNFGRDLFTAVVHGIRTSMTVVLWVTVISALIGVSVGAIAGYRGGAFDRLLMRLTELVQSIPRFFLALLVLSVFDPAVRNLVIVLGLTSWSLLARVVRAETLSIRTRHYVESARSYGARDLRIVLRHVLPNVLPIATVVISLGASRVVLLEAGLAFLGLSDPNQMSLGLLINNAQPFLEQAWWMSVFPGAAIAIAVLGINLLADSLNDLLNPLLRNDATSSETA